MRKRNIILIVSVVLVLSSVGAFLAFYHPEEGIEKYIEYSEIPIESEYPYEPYEPNEFICTSAGIEADYNNSIPSLYNGYSEYVGPWAYMMYAKDSRTPWKVHYAGDGYVPKGGDLLITGDDPVDYWYFADNNFSNANELRRFTYGSPGYIWNGHILYIVGYEDGILLCNEGNTIAPGQDLDKWDPKYEIKSSIDYVEMDYMTSETLTEDKPAEKKIRVVIETSFSPEFTQTVNNCAEMILEEFQRDPDAVRSRVLKLYKRNINWCALYVHYLLLTADQVYKGKIPAEWRAPLEEIQVGE